ncbi:MAG TPA: amidohydrolase [Thermoanaerobaculia bacterium]|nr:amidohydrolase [Thermoanaerobaculia bacterium]
MKIRCLSTLGLLSLLARRGPKPGRFRHSALALFWTLCTVFPCAAVGLAEDTPAPPVDIQAETIFHNGHIVTVDPKQPEVEALAIAQGKIIAVGDEKTVMQRRGAGTKVIDLHGKTLMPGFVEPHTHVIGTAFNINTDLMIDLSSFTAPMDPATIEQIKKKLGLALPHVPKGGWLLAGGVDPSRSIPFMASLDVATLDEVSKEVPIFVVNQSGHIAYVNTKAIEIAGIDGETANPRGGRYGRNPENCIPGPSKPCPLNGVLYEAPAYGVFQGKFNTPDFKKSLQEKMPQALAKTYSQFAAAGVTTATDLGVGTVTGNIDQELGWLKTLAKDQKTPLRIRAYLDWNLLSENQKDKGEVPAAAKCDEDKECKELMLRVIGVKFFADGSTQGLTAALKTPYDYQTTTNGDNRGELNYPDERDESGNIIEKTGETRLFEEAKPYLDQDWQLAIHANGDRATEQVLNVYERLKREARDAQHDPATLRCRIEHLTVTEEDQLKRIQELGLTPSMTMAHPYFWGYAFGATQGESGPKPILGSPRAERIDPASSLLKLGVRFSFNSDSPVSPVAPLRYISTAVTRRWQDRLLPNGEMQQGKVLGEEQRIPVDAAIRAVTLDAAYQLFLDKYVGSLEVGKLADLVILDKNPRTTTPEGIMNIRVCSTYLSGVKKYWQDGAPCSP